MPTEIVEPKKENSNHYGSRELMDKIKSDMQDIGKVELHPKFDGKQMIMVIQPL